MSSDVLYIIGHVYSQSRLLNFQVLGIVIGVMQQDHDTRQTDFHQMPYHRIFIMLFYELNAPEHVLESINYQTLTAYT